MSILIKGMEMPKNCAYCPFSEYMNTSLGQILDCKRIGTVGSAVRGTHDVLNHRHPNCPLVEIPTPHGRLIDADELVRIWKGAMFSGDIKPIVDARPTVIEAEGREE